MARIIYKYEVVLNLLRGENHLRAIAKYLNINHMTIKRILDNLVKDNILDVREQGKNNVFSLKKTLEAENIVIISEIYKVNRLLDEHPELKQDIKELRKLQVTLIVIFGSYAKNNETEMSDIDIYINTNKKEIKNKAAILNKKFNVKIGEYNKDNLLIKEILKSHIIIKGVEYFYEKNQFFN